MFSKNYQLIPEKCRFQFIIKAVILILYFGSKVLMPFAQELSVILSRPEDSSITVSVMFDKPVEFFLEYGSQSGIYDHSISTVNNLPGKPDEILLQNLLPDTRYYYRLQYRKAGTGSYTPAPEYSFHTQRAKGSSFSFTIEADEHLYDKKGVLNMYKVTLANQAEDHPDFMFSMGDTYGDDHHAADMTSGFSDSLHRVYRPWLGSICHSIPYFFCLGNHEGEFNYYLLKNPPDNIAAWGTKWRKYYFPNPYPDHFYSGNPDVEADGIGRPENYYSWVWGDALFVVLDVYRYQCDTSAKPKSWAWTLGEAQYNWLKNTLEGSNATYKFVFAHHVSGQGRGGVEQAKLFEWGGYEQNGTTWGFTGKRPGWAKPVHQLFVDNGVNIFFQGHDHLFAHEIMDGVVYQEVPMPSDSTYEIGMLANADAYISDTIEGTGHIRVTVSPSCIKVDFIRAYLPEDTVSGLHHNRENAFSYSIGNCNGTGYNNEADGMKVKVYPNPASDKLFIIMPRENRKVNISLRNAYGQLVREDITDVVDVSEISAGLYFLTVKTAESEFNRKVIINH